MPARVISPAWMEGGRIDLVEGAWCHRSEAWQVRWKRGVAQQLSQFADLVAAINPDICAVVPTAFPFITSGPLIIGDTPCCSHPAPHWLIVLSGAGHPCMTSHLAEWVPFLN